MEITETKLIKVEKWWTILISYDDGTFNEYRFGSKKQALAWAKHVDIKF